MKPLLSLLLLVLALAMPGSAQEPAAFSSVLAFDVQYYLQQNPDIARFYGGNAAAAQNHWITQGMREGRESSPVFSVKFYVAKYPDVEAAVGKGNYKAAVEHWLKTGISEGRQGSETFDVKAYAESLKGQMQDITYEKAIKHYLSLPAAKRKAFLKAPAATALAPGPVEARKDGAVKGKFYIDVDDLGVLFINGIKIHKTANGMSQSPETELKPGDRIVVHLTNATMPRYFKILFVASDKQQMVNFSNTTFRILPDPEENDFNAAQLATSARYARQIKSARNPFPYKNQSEYMWGEADVCALGAVVTKEMFVPLKLQ